MTRRRCFTPMEQLAVIANIVISASLLLPALNKPKAQGIQCQGNPRKLTLTSELMLRIGELGPLPFNIFRISFAIIPLY